MYQGSRPRGFRREEFFFTFRYMSLCNTCNPPGRSHFGPQGHYLNKRGRGLQDYTSNQILRL